MHLDAGAVQRHGFDPDAHHLRLLQFFEHPVHDPDFDQRFMRV
jgi:hypothetical protein